MKAHDRVDAKMVTDCDNFKTPARKSILPSAFAEKMPGKAGFSAAGAVFDLPWRARQSDLKDDRLGRQRRLPHPLVPGRDT